jgi:hypothetical protein
MWGSVFAAMITSFFFFDKFFCKCEAMLSFVRGAAAAGGLQRSKGGHDAGEAY